MNVCAVCEGLGLRYGPEPLGALPCVVQLFIF